MIHQISQPFIQLATVPVSLQAAESCHLNRFSYRLLTLANKQVPPQPTETMVAQGKLWTALVRTEAELAAALAAAKEKPDCLCFIEARTPSDDCR